MLAANNLIVTKGTYTISTDRTRLDVAMIHKFLAERSYWCKGIPEKTVANSIQNSLCFGVYQGTQQVGFARVITDYASFGYLADVFILEEHRSKGLSKWLVQTILGHPELQGFRRWILATADAHGLYGQFGYKGLAHPERWMEIYNPDVYIGKTFDHAIRPPSGFRSRSWISKGVLGFQ